MTLFHYKIIDKEGKTTEGTQDAKDKFALYHTIKESGGTVIFAEEVKNKTPLSLSSLFSFLGGVKTH
ncbi:MAG: hypothetical protein UU06_C0014G0001, partial [Parcubacteria group bacterium GW2011_GWB1_40_5]